MSMFLELFFALPGDTTSTLHDFFAKYFGLLYLGGVDLSVFLLHPGT